MLLDWDPRDRMLREGKKCSEDWAWLGRRRVRARGAVAKREAQGRLLGD